MSVTICWKPVDRKENRFDGGTSTSFEKLKEAFGPAIHKGDIAALRAVAKVTGDEFYSEVADVVEKVGAIEFWGEY